MSIWDSITNMLEPMGNWMAEHPAAMAALPLAAAGGVGAGMLGGLGAGAAGGMGGGGAAVGGLGEAGAIGAGAGGTLGATLGEAGAAGAGAGGIGDMLASSGGGTAGAWGGGGAATEGSMTAGLWGDPTESIMGFNPPPGLAGPGTTGAESGGVLNIGNTSAIAPTGPGAAAMTPAAPGVGGGQDLASLVASTGSGGGGTATGTGVASGAQPSILDQIMAGAGKQVTSNPIGLALGGGGLAYSMLQANKPSPATQELKDYNASLGPAAANLTSQGNEYAKYLAAGNLPPGMQEQINQATESAKKQRIASYGAQGMNTDPNKNTMLAQDLASIDAQAKIAQSQMATQLLQSGTSLINAGTNIAGLQSGILVQLANIEQNQTQSIGRAIAAFAAAMSPGVKLQLPGTQTA